MAHADDQLPAYVGEHVKTPLQEVGHGTYRKLGFRVYEASLWAPGGTWDANKPYALKLHYTRDVSKDTLSDTVVDDIRDQNVTDDATFTRWEGTLRKVLPAVDDGDTMIGIAMPGKHSLLFHNGVEIARIDDAALSNAFFNVWLGNGADEDLRAKLLGQKD